eukprot:scaffold323547_cov39-Prasinocladus_malaysianus.AAC.1
MEGALQDARALSFPATTPPRMFSHLDQNQTGGAAFITQAAFKLAVSCGAAQEAGEGMSAITLSENTNDSILAVSIKVVMCVATWIWAIHHFCHQALDSITEGKDIYHR